MGSSGRARKLSESRREVPSRPASEAAAAGLSSRRKGFVLLLAVCSLGISAFTTQLTLMRELLAVFSGNELVFGIVLGNWMLLTGVGSALGRTAGRLRRPVAVLVACQLAIAVLPPADVLLLRTLHNVVFLRGVEAGVPETVLASLVLLAPYCLLTGYLLTLACRVLGAPAAAGGPTPAADRVDDGETSFDAAGIGRVYLLDNLGDVLGGLLFTFVLVHLLSHFGILYVPALLNLLFAGLVAVVFRRPALAALAGLMGVALVAVVLRWDLDRVSRAIEYAGQQVVYSGNSPYGSLVVTESAGQYNFIENGVVLFATDNVGEVEETVHYAMAQRPDARRVLLISGGVSGTAREVLKYPVRSVDYVELDPLVLEAARRLLPGRLADPRIHLINGDGRQFVRRAARRYGVVIVDVPDPSTSQINRFYTREFFGEVHRVLEPGGVLCLSLGHYEDYMSRELGDLIAVAQRTLREVFPEVLVLPGGRNFFLASDGPLTPEVAERLERAGIRTRLVGREYLRGTFTGERLAAMRRAVRNDAPVNQDFSPVLYYYHLRWWMSQFTIRFGLLEAAVLALMAVYVVRLRPVTLAIFTTGLAASALEVVLLLAVQILCGSMYQQAGLVVTMFMLGLVVGAAAIGRLLPRCGRGHLVWLELAVAVLAASLPWGLMWLGTLQSPLAAQAVISLLALLLAALVGMEFPLAGKAMLAEPPGAATRGAGPGGPAPAAGGITRAASKLYTADYLGAALGALLVSTLLIPVLGVVTVCLLAAGLNVLSGGVLLVSKRGRSIE